MAHQNRERGSARTNVLFIDDQPAGVSDFTASLNRHGMQVNMCGGVKDALIALSTLRKCSESTNTYDAVILDVMMNVPDDANIGDHRDGMLAGVRLFRKVRDVLPEAAVIFLTNRTFTDIANLVEIDGIRVRFLSKLNKYPPSTTLLVETVAEVVEIPPWSDRFTSLLIDESYSHLESIELQELWKNFLVRTISRTARAPKNARCHDCGIVLEWENEIRLFLSIDGSAQLEAHDELIEFSPDSVRSNGLTGALKTLVDK